DGVSAIRRAAGPARHALEPGGRRRRPPDRHRDPDGALHHQGSPAPGPPRHPCGVRRRRRAAVALAAGAGGAAAGQRRARLVETGMSEGADVHLSRLSIFALCSVIAVGGATSAMPEMHRQTVDVHHWITDRSFTELFAIAQASPGPNVVFVALLGQYVGGVPGALIAMFGMCAPSCTIAYCAARV